MLVEGELFLEKYRVERLIGKGGMGAVYSAVDIDLARKVAIKVLLPHVASSRLAALRFINEGRAAARIEGNNVARVFAAGTTPSGLPYMILELLEGMDLEAHLEQRGRFGVGEAVDIVLEALQALDEAHHHGIVHRDLKPANLFLHRAGSGTQIVKVLDFGISKACQPLSEADEERDLTVTKMLLGTPFYMSPEQLLDSKKVDPRTDIWALGVILYEMLAGVPPFGGESLQQIFTSILHQPLAPLAHQRSDVPEALDAVLARCLERNLDQRIATAMDLARLLAPFGARASGAFGAHVGAPERHVVRPPAEGRPATVTVMSSFPQQVPKAPRVPHLPAAALPPTLSPSDQTNPAWADSTARNPAVAPGRTRSLVPWIIALQSLLLVLGCLIGVNLATRSRDAHDAHDLPRAVQAMQGIHVNRNMDSAAPALLTKSAELPSSALLAAGSSANDVAAAARDALGDAGADSGSLTASPPTGSRRSDPPSTSTP